MKEHQDRFTLGACTRQGVVQVRLPLNHSRQELSLPDRQSKDGNTIPLSYKQACCQRDCRPHSADNISDIKEIMKSVGSGLMPIATTGNHRPGTCRICPSRGYARKGLSNGPPRLTTLLSSGYDMNVILMRTARRQAGCSPVRRGGCCSRQGSHHRQSSLRADKASGRTGVSRSSPRQGRASGPRHLRAG
jgi:hypothetical protein